jgi:hypothetical protein
MMGQNGVNNATVIGCEKCPVHSHCGGDLCLPVPNKGFWSQGVDRSSDNPDDISLIYACSTNDCSGVKNLSVGCDFEWNILSYPNNPSSTRRLSSSRLNGTIQITSCRTGSFGPLCAACDSGYFLSEKTRLCTKCQESMLLTTFLNVIITYLISVFISSGAPQGRVKSPSWLKDKVGFEFDFQIPIWTQVSGAMNKIDPGQLKVAWTTSQIVASVAMGVGVTFPEPLASFSNTIATIVNMDFLNSDCLRKTNYHTDVYFKSAFPVLLIVVIWLSFPIRIAWYLIGSKQQPSSGVHFTEWRRRTMSELFSKSLIVFYLFIPSVTLAQFSGLDCFQLTGSTSVSFLRADSSINCNSKAHKFFVIIDVLMILIYQGILIGYLVLLYSNRAMLNPVAISDGDPLLALKLRSNDRRIEHLRFLFSDTKCSVSWFHEIVDITRRVFFLGAVPLASRSSAVKAMVGSSAALLSTVYYREVSPFISSFTNRLAYVAQWQVGAQPFTFSSFSSCYRKMYNKEKEIVS